MTQIYLKYVIQSNTPLYVRTLLYVVVDFARLTESLASATTPSSALPKHKDRTAESTFK